MGHEKGHTTRQVVKGLILDDGWRGLYRGLGPRFFSTSAWGTSMILAYEYLSMDYNFFLSPLVPPPPYHGIKKYLKLIKACYFIFILASEYFNLECGLLPCLQFYEI